MFTLSFLDISSSQIVNELKSNGYFIFEQALTEQYVEQLLQEVNFQQILVNTNDVGVVYAYNQKFLTHCLASSKKAYDVITSQKVLDICQEYFDASYKLTNHRIFQNSKHAHMPWHTDNNLQIGSKIVGKHNMPGLLFLFYLSDVTKNAFQYIQDSHTYSHKYNNEIYLSDSFINGNYKKDILTFPMCRGSIIICNIHGIHRSEPFQDKNYSRTNLLFQVDQIGSENIGHGEKNLVNTEYLDNLTPELMDYLGFNFKRNYPPFPSTSVATMTPNDILLLQKQLLPQTLNAFAKNIVKHILPNELITNGKRMLWHLKSNRLNISKFSNKQ
ncbi:phytanoyl-CoA dioxygenase family protein [Tolypothrix sp. FACHB-123]|uniref:phytanoyl-CoA dioxygenase family protein n=1 Tax=Tolypothrix sp. FACHB-123 TaxID=2692868 RepID=UPI001688897A|nr:phytanoyl-CoA dioxygenase family protein [Tolypothrix sp. FACHB-123]MBD2358431.1 phytanoyl-CoA dioxygenase family protein [Tolypothrix sp. FACHB-123]